jgi:ribulose-5-phosphate 4-epimerase/fuculose-1-phosphate aldolase
MDEQQRLIADLGSHSAMILRNHGLLVCGASVPDAFDAMFYLERACQAQVAALAGGLPLVVPGAEVAEKVGRQFDRLDRPSRHKHWPPLLRLLQRIRPEYQE